MGCQCTKKNEVSNMNLGEDNVKNSALNNTVEDANQYVIIIQTKII